MNPAAVTLLAVLLVQAPPDHDTSVDRHASLGTVVRELPGDFRRIASRNPALILGAAGAAALAVVPEDSDITRAAVNSKALDRVLVLGHAIGNGYVQFGFAFGTLFVGQLAKNPAIEDTGADLVSAQLVSGIITQTIKVSARRMRPNGGHYSFPSGHASATFATASVLQRRFGWKIGIPAYALGGYVAASRLQDNQHYLSDVIFGAAIGTVAGLVIKIHKPVGELTASAAPVEGGVALMFVLTPAR